MSDRATTVFRTSKPKETAARFVVIDNAVVQDERLSFRARGLLAYVLSMPITWEHSADSLAAASPDGVEAVRSALRELSRLGYAEFRKLRVEGGRFKSMWLFREAPTQVLPDPEKPDPVNPSPVKPTSGNTESGSAEPGKSRLSEKTVSENTISEKTDLKKEEGEGRRGGAALLTLEPTSETPANPVWSETTGWRGVTDEHRARWMLAYPACDIDRQLAQMDLWLRANPSASHKSNWLRFITNWLKRSQDNGGDVRGDRRASPAVATNPRSSSFNTRAPTAADHAKGFFHDV